MNPILAI